MVSIMRDALDEAGLPRDCIALVGDTSRESAAELMNLTGYLDVLIPRGGAGLIRSVVENTRVPVIQTGVGVCHISCGRRGRPGYGRAHPLQCQVFPPLGVQRCRVRPGRPVVAAYFLPMAWEPLRSKNVEIRVSQTQAILGQRARAAASEDWDTEFGDDILACKVVSGLEEAMDFIAEHGTGHSEAIVTNNYFTAQRFLDQVDAAAVYVNASTRFTDGGEFGLGAEIGISTQKMHARGPMGLEELTSSKYVIYGTGQVR